MQVSYLVLDEADKLLAMGFTEQVDALLAAASSGSIVRAFFSATLPEKVRHPWTIAFTDVFTIGCFRDVVLRRILAPHCQKRCAALTHKTANKGHIWMLWRFLAARGWTQHCASVHCIAGCLQSSCVSNRSGSIVRAFFSATLPEKVRDPDTEVAVKRIVHIWMHW
jgi:hypothetical protein